MQSFEHWTAYVTNNDCFEIYFKSFEKWHEGSVISAKIIVKTCSILKCVSVALHLDVLNIKTGHMSRVFIYLFILFLYKYSC